MEQISCLTEIFIFPSFFIYLKGDINGYVRVTYDGRDRPISLGGGGGGGVSVFLSIVSITGSKLKRRIIRIGIRFIP